MEVLRVFGHSETVAAWAGDARKSEYVSGPRGGGAASAPTVNTRARSSRSQPRLVNGKKLSWVAHTCVHVSILRAQQMSRELFAQKFRCDLRVCASVFFLT